MTPRRINCGDAVRLVDGTAVGIVTGTMTLQPAEPNPVIRRSVCIAWHDGQQGPRVRQPSWHIVEDVVLVAKAARL